MERGAGSMEPWGQEPKAKPKIGRRRDQTGVRRRWNCHEEAQEAVEEAGVREHGASGMEF